jgi:hypothetical protein
VLLREVGESSLLPLHNSVDQKMAVSPALGCTVSTTKQQRILNPEPETVVSAKSLGR